MMVSELINALSKLNPDTVVSNNILWVCSCDTTLTPYQQCDTCGDNWTTREALINHGKPLKVILNNEVQFCVDAAPETTTH